MVLSSCAALGLGSLAAAIAIFSVVVSPPNLGRILYKLKSFDLKGAFGESAFLPISVPALACLALVITISLTKELKMNETTLITYKKCESKSVETKVAMIKVPGCLVALR